MSSGEDELEYLPIKCIGVERQVPPGNLSSLRARKKFFNTYQTLKINRGGFGSGKRIDGLWIIFEAIPLVL